MVIVLVTLADSQKHLRSVVLRRGGPGKQGERERGEGTVGFVIRRS